MRWSRRAGCDWPGQPHPYAALDLDRHVAAAETRAFRLESGCADGIEIELWMSVGSSHAPGYGRRLRGRTCGLAPVAGVTLPADQDLVGSASRPPFRQPPLRQPRRSHRLCSLLSLPPGTAPRWPSRTGGRTSSSRSGRGSTPAYPDWPGRFGVRSSWRIRSIPAPPSWPGCRTPPTSTAITLVRCDHTGLGGRVGTDAGERHRTGNGGRC